MLARLFGTQERAITVDAMWGPWYGESTTNAGITVSRGNAMQLLSVFGSGQLIINEISTLPVESGASWIDQPTPDLSRIAFLSQLVSSMIFDGTAYCGVMSGSSSGILGMIPLDAGSVHPHRVNGRKEFRINGAPAPFEVVEIPCMMLAGAEKGLSPVEFCRQSIGLGLAAQEFGATQFAGGLNMPGVIESQKAMLPQTKIDIANAWKRKRTRGNSGLPGVLDDGATWKPTGVTNEQAQFLATRQFTAAEIAGQMFMVDPSELGIAVQGTSLTYANLAQRNTRRITFTCMPHIRRIEEALAPYARGKFRFNVDARLRGDTKTSYETLAIALQNDFMTVDEVREILGFPPLPKGATVTPIGDKVAKAQLLALMKEAPNDKPAAA
jgi:HK97 family phage portal protein